MEHDVQKIREKIGDRVLVVSVSGGKDSTATCLYLRELGLEYRAMFFNTGWEHASTYEYVNNYLPSVIGPIETLSRVPKMRTPEAEALARKYEDRLGFASPMVRWCIHKGMFPSRVSRWCTQELKVSTAKDYLRNLEDEPVNVVGIRAAESAARSRMPEWEWFDAGDCEMWRPIINWTFEDVIAIHQRHNVTPNPMYLGQNAAERVGCYPCIFSRKSEIKRIAMNSPERIDLLADLEKDMHEIKAAKKAAKGEKIRGEHTGWFWHQKESWPIHKVVQWAKTKRGGKQFELFDALPGEQGCVRWGMCDTAGKGE